MEGRLIEYRPIGGGLDYHHNSPLIGEIPPAGGDYTHAVHRSIDQLRNSINERVALGPLSVFSNTADLRTASVLAYSNQPQQQQQQLTAHSQQHHANHVQQNPNVPPYHIQSAQTNSVPNTNNNNNNSNNNNNDIIHPKTITTVLLDTNGPNTNTTDPGGTNMKSAETTRTGTGQGRGRKSRIYPNPNQHIVVTSNSVDHGGARTHNFVQHSDNSIAASSNGGVSSSNSPHHVNLDVKDPKVQHF